MPVTYIRFNAKYLDGKCRQETVNIGSYTENRNYAKELVEMFRHFLYKGNLLGYTVEVVTSTKNGEYTYVIGSEGM